MGLRSVLRFVMGITALLLSCPLPAQDPVIPVSFKGIYEFGMLGFTFGRMGVEAEQTAAHYAITSEIQLSGIARLFAQHKSHTSAKGTGADFQYPDIHYETHYRLKNKKRHVKLVYKNGGIVEEIVEPFNPRRPKAPPELKNKACDPLTFLIRLREQLAAAMAAKAESFSMLLFDGRSITRINVTMEKKPELLQYKGRKVPVVAVSVRRNLLAGFTEKEIKDFDPDEAPLYMYFSKDERLIPLVVKTKMWLGTLTGTLVKECGAGESCLLGISGL